MMFTESLPTTEPSSRTKINLWQDIILGKQPKLNIFVGSNQGLLNLKKILI